MTAASIARRMAAKMGRLPAKQAVLSRLTRHHALCLDARGRNDDAFLRHAQRFTVWICVSTALGRMEASV